MTETPLTARIDPTRGPLDLAGYRRAGGYRAVRKALKELGPQAVLDAVKASNLRGRGGAGFPTGNKWSFVPRGEDAPAPKYLVVNADEMEPGSFKDRLLLEGDPHQMIEGVILSAFAIGAEVAYVFLRGEYRASARHLAKAMAEAEAAGLLGRDILGSGFDLELPQCPGGDAGSPPHQAALPPGGRALGQAHGRQQRRDPVQRAAHRRPWSELVP
jgi:NADH-quinone oxidoreductase subunit F